MSDSITRRVSVALAVVALLAVSTVAVAHGHSDLSSADEAHCPLCIAVHRAKHAVAAPVIALCFVALETAIPVPSKTLVVPFVPSCLAQGRAPPQL